MSETETTDFDAAEILGSIERLTKDLRNASVTLSSREVRFLVDSYYAMQRDRIRASHQTRTLEKNEEPHVVLNWLTGQRSTLEKQVARALDAYSASNPASAWARSITGIGPIISAGLVTHIDITKAPTVGHIWRYAGQDPTMVWNKKEKRPWNGSLKRLCWIIGESFVKVSTNENDIYGKVYVARKQQEIIKNEALEFKSQAEHALATKNFSADTEAKKHYLTGKLPPAHIHARAKRYAVKLFLSHLHHVMYELHFNEPPPKPYVIDHMGHTHFLAPPNWPRK
jgi:hypothetical protein